MPFWELSMGVSLAASTGSSLKALVIASLSGVSPKMSRGFLENCRLRCLVDCLWRLLLCCVFKGGFWKVVFGTCL